ncbi:MAG TPA: RNase adapter RapZ [Candidatus Xenobia bacterium]
MAIGKFVVVTGLSGAGKSLVARCFEDLNYFCVDNMPPGLLPKFAQLCHASEVSQVALVLDARVRRFFNELKGALEEIPRFGYDYEMLFLEASDDVLVRRFSETRRKHPMADGGRIVDGILEERRLLQGLRDMAQTVIDTTSLSARQLRDEIERRYSTTSTERKLDVTIMSFGYKHGVPLDADLIFDVRFLPNPFYVADFRHRTGQNGEVRDFVLQFPETQTFLTKLFDMMGFLMPYYVREGKTHLTIALGCTGGKHRSVTIANELGGFLAERDYNVCLDHRDIQKKDPS